jgi:hypothetical protein
MPPACPLHSVVSVRVDPTDRGKLGYKLKEFINQYRHVC